MGVQKVLPGNAMVLTGLGAAQWPLRADKRLRAPKGSKGLKGLPGAKGLLNSQGHQAI